MHLQRITWHFPTVLAVLTSCGLDAFAGGGAEKKGVPGPLPAEIVKAWTDAGAEVGWMRLNQNGVFLFQDKGEPGAMPAFRFSQWNQGVLGKLPDPGAAFGLGLNGTKVTDEGLKE